MAELSFVVNADGGVELDDALYYLNPSMKLCSPQRDSESDTPLQIWADLSRIVRLQGEPVDRTARTVKHWNIGGWSLEESSIFPSAPWRSLLSWTRQPRSAKVLQLAALPPKNSPSSSFPCSLPNGVGGRDGFPLPCP